MNEHPQVRCGVCSAFIPHGGYDVPWVGKACSQGCARAAFIGNKLEALLNILERGK